ncbi:MAG: class I SAM-dependent methyltransferase [Acidimicrobiales bacterium]
MSRSVAALIRSAFDPDAALQVEVRGVCAGPPDPVVRLVVRDDDALAHLARHPGELGFARAYVSGALDVQGDLFELLRIRATGEAVQLPLTERLRFAARLGTRPWLAPPPAPAEEVNLGGVRGRHRIGRDRRAISHHYDVGNEFYELLLGPTMVYSCAVFEHPADSLEVAQTNKLELICRKLALEPGMRLLDVGCGWGSLVRHAALHHGVHAVGITISAEQAAYARARMAADGLADRVEIRLCDYREVGRDHFDAISSVGMSEHVGRANLDTYFDILRGLLVPQGRLLNHQIGIGPEKSRPRGARNAAAARGSFVNHYVFPDGELQDVGELVAVMQGTDLEVRHVESLREHYAITCRRWVENLESSWHEAVHIAGEGRARVWRLYLAGASVNFELGPTQVHQVLAVNTPTSGALRGRARLPLRPAFERVPLTRRDRLSA